MVSLAVLRKKKVAMAHMIHQTVTFSASPRELFNIYLDSKKHGAAIDDKVSVGRKVGSRFSAFGGMLRGRTLMIVPDRLIVQSWRASSWKKNDSNSVLILQFDRVKNGGRITLVQVNVPAHAYRNIKAGWPKHYWTPWKTYLKNRRSR
jgi:activator of HSP90 ATPase